MELHCNLNVIPILGRCPHSSSLSTVTKRLSTPRGRARAAPPLVNIPLAHQVSGAHSDSHCRPRLACCAQRMKAASEGSGSSGVHKRVPALPPGLRSHSVSKALSFGQEQVVGPLLTLKYIDYFLASGKVDVCTI